MDFIEHLRNKSVSTRRSIAFVTSATVTLAIFGLWATVWHFNLSQNSQNKSNQTAMVGASATATSSNEVSNPFGVFVEVFSTGWQGLMQNIGQIKESIKNISNPASTSPANVSSPAETSVSDSIKITQ